MQEPVIVVATDDEKQLAEQYFKDNKIIKTGVGGLNVVHHLMSLPRDTRIINFGYAGSNLIKKGTIVKIGESRLHHPNCEYEEPTYQLNGDTPCYTSNDFVLETTIKTPVLFDMELAFICAMGFENIESIKIVSDNLNYQEYEKECEKNGSSKEEPRKPN